MAPVAERPVSLDGVRVLLVEDHEAVREVIGRLLGEYGAVVTATAGVAEALRAFELERPDVVLADLEMPGANGYELIRILRARPQNRGGRTPAAALTGVSAFDDGARVLRAGYECYVAKPVDARVLVNVVATLAARRPVVRESR